MEQGGAWSQQQPFEHLAARIWMAASDRLPERLKPLAATSPLAVRVPDSRLLWHPGHRARRRFRLLLGLKLEALAGLPVGAAKLARRRPRFEAAALGPRGDALALVPSVLGKPTEDGSLETPYLELSPDREALIFGPEGTCPETASEVAWARGEAIRTALALALAGIRAAVRVRGPLLDRALLVFEWLAWAVSLRWLHDLCLAKALGDRLATNDVHVVGCPHEMNSIARTVWRVAHRHQARGVALQHAEITDGKRWYFPLPEEIAAGTECPDAMIVYDRTAAKMLGPGMPKTAFYLGCSRRYADWRDFRPPPRPQQGAALFVGALASFDNETLIGALERVASGGASGDRRASPKPPPLVVRLHPAAEVSRQSARTLRRLADMGRVELPSGRPLADDLARSAVVVGMSTTVLEEALLMDRPVVQLAHPDYFSYIDLEGVEGATRIPHDALDAGILTQWMSATVDSAPVRSRLGLDHPVVDHGALLDPDAHLQRLS